MFGGKQLLFPKLSYLREGIIKHKGDHWEKKVIIYKLDWSQIDLIKEKDHKNWNKKYHSYTDIKFIGTIPEDLRALTEDMEYAIDEKYAGSIHFFYLKAQEIYCNTYPHDTVVREWCLNPADSCIIALFKLINDCTYDEKEQYFKKFSDEKMFIPHLMAFRFWIYQAGRGLLFDKSGFNEIESSFLAEKRKDLFYSYKNSIEDFLKRMELEYEKMNNRIEIKD
jgi:hypothetical protein